MAEHLGVLVVNTLVVYSEADTWINYYTSTTNYGTDQTGIISGDDGSAYYSRALLKFPLTSLPSGARVTSVVLSIYNASTLALTQNATLHRTLKTWVETESTWVKASSSENWASAGCNSAGTDRASASMGSLVINDVAEWKTSTLTLSEFELMRKSNLGLVIVPSEARARTLLFREFTTPGYVPYLTITYAPVGNPATFLSDYGVL